MNIKKMVAGLVIGLLTMPAMAQMPSPNSLQQSGATTANLSSQIDGLLRVGAGEMMAGISGYDVSVGDLIGEYVEKELVKALAEASVFSPLAVEIMDIYMEYKNGQVADEVDKIKNLTKDALSRQLKIRYQDFKLKYEKLYAKASNNAVVKYSVTSAALPQDMRNLYGDYVDVLDGFYERPGGKLLKEQDANDVEYNLISTAITLSNDELMKAKLAVANTEYNPSKQYPSGEVTARSVYERMVIKRQIAREILTRKAALQQFRGYTDRAVKNLLMKQNRKAYYEKMNLPSNY